MKIAGFPNQSGSRYWRLEDPFAYLRRLGHEAEVVTDEGISDRICQWADIIVLQSTVSKEDITCAYAYQQMHGLKIVADADDLFDLLEDDNPNKLDHDKTDAKAVIGKTLQIADLVTVTTPYLREQLLKYNDNIEILPNYMDLKRWDLPIYENDSKEIRIGWAGSMTHVKDFELVVEPLKRILKRYPKAKLIILGDPRIADLFKGFPVETVLGVDFDAYPARLHSLRLDIGIAPLRDSEFNKGKSNIKALEYGICKIPAIFSPTVYQGSVCGVIARTKTEWFESLNSYVLDAKLRKADGQEAYTWVKENYNLEEKIRKWEKAYRRLLT